MFITGNFDRLAVKAEQRDEPADVIRRQAGVGVDGKRVLLRKADHTATRIIVVVMRLEAAFGLRRWLKVFMVVIMSTVADGVPVRFAIGKRYRVNQEVGVDFEKDADFFCVFFHCMTCVVNFL